MSSSKQNYPHLPGKIRKRGCNSSASSTSSIVQNYKFKRAILVGKRGSRSTTPVPTWNLLRTHSSSASALRSVDSRSEAAFVNSSKQQPVSARKLAATLWEMNEMPSPKLEDDKKMRRVRERERGVARSLHSGSLPPHLSDPSHSPASQVGVVLFDVNNCA